jgi:WD40 repeat protein
VAFRSDGVQVAVLCKDGHILVAAPETGRIVWRLRHDCKTPFYPAIPFIAFSDQRLVTIGPDSTVAAHDLVTGQLCYRRQSDQISCAVMSPDGKTLATGGEVNPGLVRFWDVAMGEFVGTPLSHPDWINDIQFGPGGLVLTACRDQGHRILISTIE